MFFVSHFKIQHLVQCSVLSLQHWDLSQPYGRQDRRQQTAATQGKTCLNSYTNRKFYTAYNTYQQYCTDWNQSAHTFTNEQFLLICEKSTLKSLIFACVKCTTPSLFVLHTVVEWTSALVLQYSEIHCLSLAAGPQRTELHREWQWSHKFKPVCSGFLYSNKEASSNRNTYL